MKIARRILIVAGVLVAVFLVGAALIPSTYKVERVATINAPAAKIYALIADPRAWTRWSVWNQREPNMKLEFSGPASGQGAKWAWEGKDGKGNMEFVAARPDQSIEYALAFPDMGMSSRGAFTLAPAGNATRVSWTNEGDVGRNALMRWFVPFMDSMMGPDFEGGLANLKALAEKQP
jgi:uncharacterized protein YndB with AHSA1/START domain